MLDNSIDNNDEEISPSSRSSKRPKIDQAVNTKVFSRNFLFWDENKLTTKLKISNFKVKFRLQW